MKIGSMFTGYGGLDMAVEQVTGATPAWFVEHDPAPSKVLAHHWPNVPNHHDVTAVDWDSVEPVDILTGGFPCQDLSHAGKRLGLRPGTRSGLWEHMAYAIDQLRPRLVVIENVRGLLSANAHSDLEPCPWCVGGAADGEPALRALGAVLGDLAGLGYDAQWSSVRASDVGAPHGRFRVFIVAHPHGEHGDRGGTVGRTYRPRSVCYPRRPHGTGKMAHPATTCQRTASSGGQCGTCRSSAAADAEGIGEPEQSRRAHRRRALGCARVGAGRRDVAGNAAARVQVMGRGSWSWRTAPTVRPEDAIRPLRPRHSPVGGHPRSPRTVTHRTGQGRPPPPVPRVRGMDDGPTPGPRHRPGHRPVTRPTTQGPGQRGGALSGRSGAEVPVVG